MWDFWTFIYLGIMIIIITSIIGKANTIINYVDIKPELGDSFADTLCVGGICQNRCNNMNGQEVKRTSDIKLISDDSNIYQAENCGNDKVLKELDVVNTLCGYDGTSPCTVNDCCRPKQCSTDTEDTPRNKAIYFKDKKLVTDADIQGVVDETTLQDLYTLHNDFEPLWETKYARDGNCPYQKKVRLDTNCTGTTSGVGQDCGQAECCINKTCSTDWSGTADWSGGGATCPSVNTKIKYDDDIPCDTCDDTDCCYTPSLYCSVSTADPSNAGNHTNIREVPISGTNYDLTEDALDILKKTNLDAPRKAEIDLAITCSTGYQYGMCDGAAGSDPASTCNTHDNNERLCLSNGCEFRRGDHPRVSYVGCDNGADQNSILVGNCINTCTADVSLAEARVDQPNLSTYFFVGVDSATAATAATAALVKPLYDPGFSDKDSQSDDWPGTMTEPATTGIHATLAGTVKKICGSSNSSGHRLQYDYTCNGGGSYFSVSKLSDCNQTCDQLYNDGTGHSCGDDKIYSFMDASVGQPAMDENGILASSVYTSYDSFVNDCCTPKTCSNSSGGISVYCRPYEKPATTQPDPSAINSNTCCESKTCADFINDYNTEWEALTPTQQMTQGEEAAAGNVCPDGDFMPDKLINNRYLGITSTNGELGINITSAELGITSAAVINDLNATDIGCCEHLTCSQWATGELDKEKASSTVADDMTLPEWGNNYCSGPGSDPTKPSFNMSGSPYAATADDAAVTTNACCVSGDAITCSPTDEMNATAVDGIRIPGYSFTGDGDGPTNQDADFNEISFTLDRGGKYHPTNTGETPQSNSTCATNYTGTPILECLSHGTGDAMINTYSITGCVPEQVEIDRRAAAQSHCASGSELASPDKMKICQVPAADSHPGVVFSNFTSGVSANGLVNMDNFAHQLNIITCENSSNTPCIQSCVAGGPSDPYDQFSISGCEYQNKLPGTDLHSDFYWNVDQFSSCSDLHGRRIGELQSPSTDLIAAGNANYFTCKCPDDQDGHSQDQCAEDDRETRFKYIFAEDNDNFDVNSCQNADATAAPTFTSQTTCEIASTGNTWDANAVAGQECTGSVNVPGPGGGEIAVGGQVVVAADLAACEQVATGRTWVSGTAEQTNSARVAAARALGVTWPDTATTTGSSGNICDDGYFPFRGPNADYCKKCLDTSGFLPSENAAHSLCDNTLGADGFLSVATTDTYSDPLLTHMYELDNMSYNNDYRFDIDDAGTIDTANYAQTTVDLQSDDPPPLNFATKYKDPTSQMQVVGIIDFSTTNLNLSNIKDYWNNFFKDYLDTTTGAAQAVAPGATGEVAGILYKKNSDGINLDPVRDLADVTQVNLATRGDLVVGGTGAGSGPVEICANSNTTPSFASEGVGTCTPCQNTEGNKQIINNLRESTGANPNVKLTCSLDAGFYDTQFNEGNIISVTDSAGHSCGGSVENRPKNPLMRGEERGQGASGWDIRPPCCDEGFIYFEDGVGSPKNKCFPFESTIVNNCDAVGEQDCNKSMQSSICTHDRSAPVSHPGSAPASGPTDPRYCMKACVWTDAGAGAATGAGTCSINEDIDLGELYTPPPNKGGGGRCPPLSENRTGGNVTTQPHSRVGKWAIGGDLHIPPVGAADDESLCGNRADNWSAYGFVAGISPNDRIDGNKRGRSTPRGVDNEPSEPYFKDEREFRYVSSCQASVGCAVLGGRIPVTAAEQQLCPGGASDDRLNTWTALPWSNVVNYCDLVTVGNEYNSPVLGQAKTLDWIDTPVEAPASLAKQGIPTRINAPGTVMSDDTDQLLNSALDKYYLVDQVLHSVVDDRIFLDQIHEGVVDLSVREGSSTDPGLVNEKAFSKCWQDCMDTDSCDFVKYNTGSYDVNSMRQAPGTTGGPFQYVPGHCTRYKLADAVNIGEARNIDRSAANMATGNTETDKSILAINRDSTDASWGVRTHSMDIIPYSSWQNGLRTYGGMVPYADQGVVVVDAPDLDTPTMKSSSDSTNSLLVNRTWNVSGVYLQQNSSDFNLEPDYNKDAKSSSGGTAVSILGCLSPQNCRASSHPQYAVALLGGLETRFGTQNFIATVHGQGISDDRSIPNTPEDRPYWKKTGGPGTPDLFLFYANNSTWLISTKLTCLWPSISNNSVPPNNKINAEDGFIVASFEGSWEPGRPAGQWTTYLPGASGFSPTITTSIWNYNPRDPPTKFNDTSPTQDEINAAISGASLTPEQEAVMRRDKIGNRRKNTMLKILGREEVAGSSGWPATSPTTQKGLPFVDGPSGGADNEKWISMNKIRN